MKVELGADTSYNKVIDKSAKKKKKERKETRNWIIKV